MDFRNAMKLRETANIETDYMITEELGRGSFGQVCVGKHTSTDVECAIKVIDKVKLQNKGDKRLFNLLESEIDVL